MRACGFTSADEQYETEKEYQQISHEICVRMKNDVIEIETTQEKWIDYIFPKMPMVYLGDNIFELISWPIKFTFSEENGKRTLFVSGGYDWEYDGVSFSKIN